MRRALMQLLVSEMEASIARAQGRAREGGDGAPAKALSVSSQVGRLAAVRAFFSWLV